MMKKICIDGGLNNLSLFSADKVINNEDLRREILLRLPVRSIIRFKLVSKQWKSLISDPEFARDQTSRINPNSVVPSGLYFYNSLANTQTMILTDNSCSQEIESVSLDDSPIQLSRVRIPSLSFLQTAAAGHKIIILQSCNGLLLFEFCELYSLHRSEYCVCNPTTKSYKILPTPDLNSLAYEYALAFDPSISPHYKVICCVRNNNVNRQIKIYSSETGKWSTSINCSVVHLGGPLGINGCYWNGSVHWIEKYGCRYNCHQYDLVNDDFKIFDIPRTPTGFYNHGLRYFGESRDRLHLVYAQNNFAKKFRVFEMDRETLRWSVIYRVHLCHLLSEFPEICVKIRTGKMEYAFSVLTILKGEKEEDSALVLTIPGKVISYNLHYKKSKVLRDLPSQLVDTSRYHCISGFNFIESFALV